MTIPAYLLPNDGCEKRHLPLCLGDCSAPVKVNSDTGRWFITMGHPGFNTRANNFNGYTSKESALATLKKFSKR